MGEQAQLIYLVNIEESENITGTIRHELFHAYFWSLTYATKREILEKMKLVFKPCSDNVHYAFYTLSRDGKWEGFLLAVEKIVRKNYKSINLESFFKSIYFIEKYIESFYFKFYTLCDNLTIPVVDEIMARMIENNDVHPAFLSYYEDLFDEKVLSTAIHRNGITEEDLKNMEKIDKEVAQAIVVDALKKLGVK
jgi:hypothetical protein